MDDKTLLGDFIYQLHKKRSFYSERPIWSDPSASFTASTEGNIAQKVFKFQNNFKEVLREPIDELICILADWENVAYEGIFFTTKAIYVNSPKNCNKKFRVRYDDITDLKLYSWGELDITDYENEVYEIDTKLWDKTTIKMFLEFASHRYNYSQEEKLKINDIELPNLNNQKVGDIIAGTVYGNVSNAYTIYGEEKFHANQGHGYAAERANTLYDKYMGRDARILGDDNAKNGADRIVDGIKIQSKYYENSWQCISDCFENGKFRYMNDDGTPMQIEVASDKYDDAVKFMKSRISNGEVPGVTDPDEATKIVRKGRFTYEQAKNIAKAGTVESLTYDALNGAIIATTTFGITAILSFATSVWNGEELDFALKDAAFNGLKVGAVSFIVAIAAGQITKAGRLNSALVESTEAIAKFLGPKRSAMLANALREDGAKKIYGEAATKSTAKTIRTNIITGIASVVVLSSGDIISAFRGRISVGQLFKNIANTTASAAGGTAGFIAGAAAGSVFPGVGTVIGGIAGALGGGKIAEAASSAVLDNFIKDDAEEMMKIVENMFAEIATDYLLTQREVDHVIDHMAERLDVKSLKDMYASENRKKFAKTLILPLVEQEIGRRKKIGQISLENMQYGLRLLIEDIAESEESEN